MIICAGDGSTDTCYGDSGGPLTLTRYNIINYLVGITSYGIRGACGSAVYQGIYTNVNHYVPWILENLEP